MQALRHQRLQSVLVAATALAMLANAAQAAPHYYVNGAKVKEGVANTKTTVGWGTLTFKGVKGGTPDSKVICHYVIAGTLFYPTGGMAGEGLTQAFASFQCEEEFSVCPAGTTSRRISANNLPWHVQLTEEVVGTIRQETLGFKVTLECFEAATRTATGPFVVPASEKGQRPALIAGSSALHPSFLEFLCSATGVLEAEGSQLTIEACFLGVIKTFGYNAQELIHAANP